MIICFLYYANSYSDTSDTAFIKYSLLGLDYGYGKELTYQEYDYSSILEHRAVYFETNFINKSRFIVELGYIKCIEKGIDFWEAPGSYIEEKHRFHRTTDSYLAKILVDYNWKYFGLNLGFAAIKKSERRYLHRPGENVSLPLVGIKIGYIRSAFIYGEICEDPLLLPFHTGLAINILNPFTKVNLSIGNSFEDTIFLVKLSHLIIKKYFFAISYIHGMNFEFNGFRLMLGYSFLSN